MKPCLYLLITALFIVSCDQQEVDASRLVTRNETTYEINSDTPFTGVSLSYYVNGQVLRRLTYKDGKMDGIQRIFHENGWLRERATFKDGLLQGDFAFTFHDNGMVSNRTSYKNGKPDGISETYAEDGRIISRMEYKDGELASAECLTAPCQEYRLAAGLSSRSGIPTEVILEILKENRN